MTTVSKPSKRVLVLADFGCSTGFAQVAHNVVAQVLQEKEVNYFIDVVGINYYGLPNEWQKIYPRVRIFPAAASSQGDLFGRNAILNMLSTGVYDLLWILQDTFNIEPIAPKIKEIRTKLIENGKKPFKWIFYYPIDAAVKENWITQAVSLSDYPVAYTQYGYNESVKWDKTLENRLRIIPHGTDINQFYPVDDKEKEEFRQDYFVGLAKDKFLVTNVNRNQPRKDVARTLQIFRLFKNRCPDALLYLHMKVNDVAYDLNEVARHYDLIPDEDYIVPSNFNEHDGLPIEIMNMIYNASDVIMTTTLGEGWGLSMTEAMATKTPVIAPDHTALTEILADQRGVLVPSGKSQTDWMILSADNERLRPLVSVADYVDKLVAMRQNYPLYKENAQKAYQHLLDTWTWDKVGASWREVFKTACTPQKAVKIGRNDPCYCGSGKKYKNCHGHE